MTRTVLASLRRVTDGIDGERFAPPATMLAVGVAGTLWAPDLFRAPVGTLIAMVVVVAGARLVFLPFGHPGPRPTVYRLLRAVLAAVSTAVSRVVSFLGLSAWVAVSWAAVWWAGYDGGMPYPGLFTTAFSYAMVLIGPLLVTLALCRLFLAIITGPVRVAAPVLDRSAFPAPPTGVAVAVIVRAGRAVLDDRPRVTAAGALDWLGDDPGPRAAAQQILRSVTPPGVRR
jgi:hypothetical protein